MVCILLGVILAVLPGGDARARAEAPLAGMRLAPFPAPVQVSADFWQGRPLPGALLGQTLDTFTWAIAEQGTQSQLAVEVARGLRGPAAGLVGEFYSWVDPLGLDDPRRRLNPAESTIDPQYAGCPSPPPQKMNEMTNLLGTLDFLRLNREHSSLPLFVVNSRGLANWFTWPEPEDNPYVTTDQAEIQALAADWVFYTQYVVRRFDQAHPPSASSSDPLEQRAAALLARLRWESCGGSRPGDLLPAAGEARPTGGAGLGDRQRAQLPAGRLEPVAAGIRPTLPGPGAGHASKTRR